MRVIGLDLGSKTCGVALSDQSGLIASGIKTLHFEEEDYEEALRLVKDLYSQLQAEKIVVGWPKHLNGDVGQRGWIAQRFAELLQEELGTEVELWDERLTTVAAERLLISADVSRKKRKAVIDKLAAVYILQAYLDAERQKKND